jgi:hypothetical protein
VADQVLRLGILGDGGALPGGIARAAEHLGFVGGSYRWHLPGLG